MQDRIHEQLNRAIDEYYRAAVAAIGGINCLLEDSNARRKLAEEMFGEYPDQSLNEEKDTLASILELLQKSRTHAMMISRLLVDIEECNGNSYESHDAAYRIECILIEKEEEIYRLRMLAERFADFGAPKQAEELFRLIEIYVRTAQMLADVCREKLAYFRKIEAESQASMASAMDTVSKRYSRSDAAPPPPVCRSAPPPPVCCSAAEPEPSPVRFSSENASHAKCTSASAPVRPKRKPGLLGIFGRGKEKKEDNDSANSIPVVDNVQFSAVAPEKVQPGKYVPVNIVMYQDEFRQVVDNLLGKLGKNAKESTGGYHDVTRKSSVKVVLTSPDLAIEDNELEQIWNGKYLNFDFAVKIPDDFQREQILFTANVYINQLIATRLKLILDCDGKPKRNLSISRSDILSAFISYASQDRTRVAAIIQGMQAARPDMDIFFDVMSLRSGQKWEEILTSEIEKRDVLFLCWSKFAKQSQWVDKEWRYALTQKGEDCIEPIPIDTPDVCPPPAELQNKHFNNQMVYMIKANRQIPNMYPCLMRIKTNDAYYLNGPQVNIGKSPDMNDIVIPDNMKISRKHAMIQYENDTFYITDNGSKNHTFVNGECIPAYERVVLSVGSVVRFADEEFEFIMC